MDVKKIRKDFKMLDNVMMQGHPLIYFDNAATTLKPQCVGETVMRFYNEFTSNVHRGDSDLSARVDKEYDLARTTIAKFINAKFEEIVFTSGTTAALNLIAQGYALNNLHEGDEIIINEAEHASNILPWYDVAKHTKAKIVYAPLDEEGKVTVESIKNTITNKTKIIAIAQISNVLGFEVDVKNIIKEAHKHDIIVVVDAAQSAPHLKIDVQDLDCDFLCFGAHKMCGPSGIGVLYGKYELLCKTSSTLLGGGMNSRFDECGNILLKKPPYKFEGGTPNIEGVLGFKTAIDYLENIGMDNIHQYELELKKYAVEKLKKLDNIILYNANSDSGIITFNIKNVFCQDAGSYFNYQGIAVRSGHHCAKILPNYLHVTGTVRASLYFYNTKEEIDSFVEACKNGGDYLDAFFK